jgi:DNA-binding XRE family transcriptional regulator
MTKKDSRFHRPRVQTPEQEAEEKAIRQRYQTEKPSLQTLLDSGDIQQVFTMGEYWELRKTFAALKALREQQGLSVADLASRAGLDQASISHLEDGQVDNLTIATVTGYANALGKRVLVKLADARVN